MLYRYTAITPAGRKVNGLTEAGHIDDLEQRLSRNGLELIAARAGKVSRSLYRTRLSRREQIDFCFHLEQMLQAGIPMLEALNDFLESAPSARWTILIGSLITAIDSGRTLSEALAERGNAFGPVFVALIRAGEQSGELPAVLSSLHAALQWEDELTSSTRRLFAYPAFVASAVLGSTLFLMLHLVPQLQNFIESNATTLPFHTRLLFAVSHQLREHWLFLMLILLLVPLAGLGLWRLNASIRHQADHLLLRLPALGPLLGKLALARQADTLARLYAAGIPLIDAIRMTGEVVTNRALRSAWRQVEQDVCQGTGLSAAFAGARLFPPLLIRMLRIGENTGALEISLTNLSRFYRHEVGERVARVQTLIEPVMTLLSGALLGWVMLSALAPIYDLISRIKP